MTGDFERRHIPFEACWNFRDIGGYSAPSGEVQWGRYFRSGALEEMTPADRERLASLGVRTIIDLRQPTEASRSERHPAANVGAQYLRIPPIPDGGSRALDGKYGAGISGERYLGYLEFAGEAFREIFARLADPATYPLVLHCTSGKDRTGVVTAMALETAGVDRETIVSDFELTNRDTERRFRWLEANGRLPASINPDEARLSFGVPAGAIAVFLDGLATRFGGVEVYLRSVGLSGDELAAVREALLTPVSSMEVQCN